MIPKVIDAKCVHDYVIWIKFNDGSAGEVDLRDQLWGPVFEPLKDQTAFRKFSVHTELQTLVWENGADLSPEFLHRSLQMPA